jgi:hypothetical protein
MATDSITIANLALAKIGSIRIASFDDASQPARYLKLFFDQTRDEVLRAHDWNFASKRATLTALAAAPEFGWDYQYQLPVDCLMVRQLNAWQTAEPRGLFEIEGRVLLTDSDGAQIRYTYQVADASLFDALFVEALATRLASKICQPLTGSRQQGMEYLADYNTQIGQLSMQKDAAEARGKRKLPWVESDLVRHRFYSEIL